MDFNMLTRRDLQALCKRNKIPANMTNVAMAESLKALEFVEGIEEFSQTCQSETAQSSIESPGKSEVTSPYVPPTGGRSTRRRNVANVEPETAKPSARAPRTTRKAAIETPAMVSQSSRKKVQIASACKKMDFQSKECIDEENSGVSATPAPSAGTTRRRRVAKEESTVNHAYSTRRSTRLAMKNVQLTNEAGNENLDFSKKELFTDDCQESKTILNEGPGDLDEVSGTSGGVDADITMEVNSEKEVEEKQDMPTNDMEEPVPPIEDEVVSNQSEADGAKLELKDTCDVEIEEVGFDSKIEAEAEKDEHDGTDAPNDEVVSAEKQEMSTCDEVGFGFETEAEGEKKECDETEVPSDEIKAEENDGSLDVKASEIEAEVVEIEQNQAVNYGENVILEREDKSTDEDVVPESEVSCEARPSEIKIDVENTEEDERSDLDETVSNVDAEDVSEMNVSYEAQPSEIKIDVENTEEDETVDTEDVSEMNVNMEVVSEMNVNMEVVEINDLGEKEIKSDASDSVTVDQNTDDLSLSEMSMEISLMNEEEEVSKWETVFAYVNEKHDNAEVLPCLTPASKAYSSKKVRTPAVSDNKENNIGKLVFTSEGDKTFNANEREEKLKQLSVRKLTKMLKEKLNITKESSLNENGNEEVPAVRQALQALPENRKA